MNITITGGWLAAITGLIIAGIVYLLKIYIPKRIERAVDAKYEKEFANYKADLDKKHFQFSKHFEKYLDVVASVYSMAISMQAAAERYITVAPLVEQERRDTLTHDFVSEHSAFNTYFRKHSIYFEKETEDKIATMANHVVTAFNAYANLTVIKDGLTTSVESIEKARQRFEDASKDLSKATEDLKLDFRKGLRGEQK